MGIQFTCTTDNCVVCGKEIKITPKRVWVERRIAGGYFAKGDPQSETEASQGWFPVGAGCVRSLPKGTAKKTTDAIFGGA